MPRILYACPDSNVPTGGIKVIYKHVELLRELGHDAYVMHLAREFSRCTWFASAAPVVHLHALRSDDLVVVPEVMIELTYDLHKHGVRFCVFVQNGYLVLPHTNVNAVRECYSWAEAVFSISDDTTSLQTELFPECAGKIVRVQYSVDPGLFHPEQKERTVLYMPRKLPTHARNVVPWLASQFPDWSFVELDGLSETEVAEEMRRARIFLAFSDLEGCPVPPIEAALSGNIVVGYPGWGGEEYWREPNFRRVEMGNLREFARKFSEAAKLAGHPEIDAVLAPGVAALASRYSRAREAELLGHAIGSVLAG
jgi:hypothetical protein